MRFIYSEPEESDERRHPSSSKIYPVLENEPLASWSAIWRQSPRLIERRPLRNRLATSSAWRLTRSLKETGNGPALRQSSPRRRWMLRPIPCSARKQRRWKTPWRALGTRFPGCRRGSWRYRMPEKRRCLRHSGRHFDGVGQGDVCRGRFESKSKGVSLAESV